MALNAIVLRRRKRGDERDNRNGVVADALWYYLKEIEKVPRERIEDLFPPKPQEPAKLNVTTIRKKGDKIES